MPELSPWPYSALPSVHDVTLAGVRRVIQRTEDGYYGFALVGEHMKLSMAGPENDSDACAKLLRRRISANGLHGLHGLQSQ